VRSHGHHSGGPSLDITLRGREDSDPHHPTRALTGTEVAAVFASLIEHAKLAGAQPEQYLRAVTRSSIRGVPIWLPDEVTRAGVA
jgi:hypothetical protein